MNGNSRMLRFNTCVAASCLLAGSATAVASPATLDIALIHGFHHTNAANSLDEVDSDGVRINGSNALAWRLGYALGPQLALEAGTREGIETTDSGSDSRGEYRLSIRPHDVTIGLSWRFAAGDNGSWAVHGGLMQSTVKVTLDERFYGVKPAGSVSTSNTCVGGYIEADWSYPVSTRLDAGIRLGYALRPGAFETVHGDVSLSDTYIGVGTRFTF